LTMIQLARYWGKSTSFQLQIPPAKPSGSLKPGLPAAPLEKEVPAPLRRAANLCGSEEGDERWGRDPNSHGVPVMRWMFKAMWCWMIGVPTH
jgi:hypothetical protein